MADTSIWKETDPVLHGMVIYVIWYGKVEYGYLLHGTCGKYESPDDNYIMSHDDTILTF